VNNFQVPHHQTLKLLGERVRPGNVIGQLFDLSQRLLGGSSIAATLLHFGEESVCGLAGVRVGCRFTQVGQAGR
jgi:hypothetical protein